MQNFCAMENWVQENEFIAIFGRILAYQLKKKKLSTKVPKFKLFLPKQLLLAKR
jgi:hypothetical protein